MANEGALPALTPFITYEDTDAAVKWLARAFGFEPGLVMRDEAGRVNHADLSLGDAVIALGMPYAPMRSQSPRALGGASTAHLYIYVDDVEIIAEPKDESHGDRTYRAADLEGHTWRFAQRLSAP
ncbi:MAG: glyoxalase/bleomycin resistance/extradiol dioxygenase family protein [Dehalococcoidia bacterium]|nr:glyoxalase/bleomycin resistance/extradiol dioxygenase family protein [Dehalococcoidia bacterium]